MAYFWQTVNWFEVIRMAPSIATAAAAIYGVQIARTGIDRWRREIIGKRKAELAEDVLADFYQAREILNAARSPMGYDSDGSTRTPGEGESADETKTLNMYFATIERLQRHQEFFAGMEARKYRFWAYFGPAGLKCFDDFRRLHAEVVVATRMLIRTYRVAKLHEQMEKPGMRQSIEKWEAKIWWDGTPEDIISKPLDELVSRIEEICKPIIRDGSV